MKFIKLSAGILIAGLSLTGCGSLNQNERVEETNPYPRDLPDQTAMVPADHDWARENLDLQAVGTLLQKADDAEEFERLLNARDGVNNLDLNGDGDVDYISVREFGEEDNQQRGFSLFSMFGPDLIQEIATIFFDRDNTNLPGARVLLAGNEQIYGDNNYYETNWADRGLSIVSWLYRDRQETYQSPYYYDNYPDYYEPYQAIETPVYRSRLERFYTSPVFVQASAPTVTKIKIKSPLNGRSMEKIYSKLAKPTREQIDFLKNNPNPPKFAKVKKGDFKDDSARRDDRPKDNPNRDDKKDKRNDDRLVFEDKPNKRDKAEKRAEKQEFKAEKQEFKMSKQDRKGGGDNPNKGGGNKGNGKSEKGGGGGKGNGGCKGGGKKN